MCRERTSGHSGGRRGTRIEGVVLTLIYCHLHVKQIASEKLLYNTWESSPHQEGEKERMGSGEEFAEGEDIYKHNYD